MKSLARLALIALALPACSSTTSPDAVTADVRTPSRQVDDAATEIAKSTLPRIRELLAKGAARSIGFGSAEELDRASLGVPIPIYVATREAVASHAPGDDPHVALGTSRELMVPVEVDGMVKAAVVVASSGPGKWELVSVGRAHQMRDIDAVRRKLATERGGSRISLFTVPETGVRLLAHEEQGDVLFTAFSERGAAGLPVGEPVKSERALSHLAEFVTSRIAAPRRAPYVHP
ncbi:MAG TPA: hypothetical protein VGI39_33720 [Polyangiaceae bacterium]|jgi:hypothetical protein